MSKKKILEAVLLVLYVLLTVVQNSSVEEIASATSNELEQHLN